MENPLEPLAFETRAAWRAWLDRFHEIESEAWLLIQKKHSNQAGLRLAEAVEEALCFGWIDGTLHPRDEAAYLLRFSPRRPDSVWSLSNIRRVERLLGEGRMTRAGLAMVQDAKRSGQWQAAMDRERTEVIPPDLHAALRRRKGALAAYRDLPVSKKKQYLYWIQSAKREETQRKRIAQIVQRVLDER